MRKSMLAVLFTATLLFSCKKDSVQQEAKPIDLFFRLALVVDGGYVTFSKVITTKSTTLGGEITGDSNPGNNGNGNGNGNGEGNEHHDGDGCDENKPDFCHKHPWHKKCQILDMKLDYFVLSNDNKTVTVSWKAIDETTLVKYVLQRSTDAVNFKDVVDMTPKGTTFRYTYKETVK